MYCRMTYIPPDPSFVALLLSAGAERLPSGAYTVPLDGWLKQRETIESERKRVGPRHKPSMFMTFSCARCGNPGTDSFALAVKRIKKTGRDVLYCGKACATRVNNVRRGMREFSVCLNCHAPLTARPYGDRDICSEACEIERRAKVSRIKAQNCKRFLKDIPEQPCETCKRAFRPRSLSFKRRFCSKSCANIGHARGIAGWNNPAWRGGVNGSRTAQYRASPIRDKVRTRDGFRCVACGDSDRIQTHHINLNNSDHRVENLVTLCRMCHIQLHAGERSKPKVIVFPWLKTYAESATFGISKLKEQTVSSPMES